MSEKLLALVPGFLEAKETKYAIHDHFDQSGRLYKGFHFDDGFVIQILHCLFGSLESGQRFSQVLFAVDFKFVDLVLLDGGLLCFLCAYALCYFSLLLLFLEFDHELFIVPGVLLQNGLELLDLLLQLADNDVRLVQSLEPHLILSDFEREDVLLYLEHFDIKLEQFKVAGGGNVDPSAQFIVKLLAQFADLLVNLHGELTQVLSEGADSQMLPLAVLSIGHRIQRLNGPFVVPVERAAVDDGRVLQTPGAQFGPDGRKR